MKYFLSLFCILFTSTAIAKNYPVSDVLCDGYPRASIGTKEGVCVGVVAQANDSIKWVKPRRIVQVADTAQFIVTDMGGWTRGKGTVWLLDTAKKPAKLTPLITDLKLSHGLQVGPEGFFYVGETHRIFRFRLKNNKAKNIETVISDLPDSTTHSHPLSHFIFDNDNNLIVNIGAASDQCKEDSNKATCSTVSNSLDTYAALRRYYYISEANIWSNDYEILATGLRNSMALASHSSGTFLQAENSIDLPGLHSPFEEINEIKEGAFYGWPYCYDNQKINPIWKEQGIKVCKDAVKYQQPWIVLPAHAAPLDMLYYNGKMFDFLKGSLLLSWHGYRETGHRLVSYKVDAKGLPVKSKNAHYFFDGKKGNSNYTKIDFPAEIKNISQGEELISEADAVLDTRPMVRPVGMTVADDGAIWVIDDINKAVLRLAKGISYQSPRKPPIDNEKQDNSLDGFFVKVDDSTAAKVFLDRCQACHGLPSTVKDMKIPTTWLVEHDGESLIEERIFHSLMRPMPPNSPLKKTESAAIKAWLNKL